MQIRSSWGSNLKESFKGAMNNARGRQFESWIDAGCRLYKMRGIALVEKTPEPFRCLKKDNRGRAIVQFIHHAQPDYKGVLINGRAIIFEAKSTTKDRIQQGVLTAHQAEMLRAYWRLGAYTAVCIDIQDHYFFVPFEVFDNMKEFFGRKYATAEDLKPWAVRFDGAIHFLDKVDNLPRE